MPRVSMWAPRERIPSGQIASLEIATQEHLKEMAGVLAGGIVGAVFFGPIGLLAGMLSGGDKTAVTFICRFRDGRRFLGRCDAATYAEFQAASLARAPAPIVPAPPPQLGFCCACGKPLSGAFCCWCGVSASLTNSASGPVPDERLRFPQSEWEREPMYCNKCGKETLPGAAFCRFCGQAVEPRTVTSSQASPVTAKAVQPQMFSPTVNKGKMPWVRRHPVLTSMAGLFIFLYIVGLIIGPEKPASTTAQAQRPTAAPAAPTDPNGWLDEKAHAEFQAAERYAASPEGKRDADKALDPEEQQRRERARQLPDAKFRNEEGMLNLPTLVGCSGAGGTLVPGNGMPATTVHHSCERDGKMVDDTDVLILRCGQPDKDEILDDWLFPGQGGTRRQLVYDKNNIAFTFTQDKENKYTSNEWQEDIILDTRTNERINAGIPPTWKGSDAAADKKLEDMMPCALLDNQDPRVKAHLDAKSNAIATAEMDQIKLRKDEGDTAKAACAVAVKQSVNLPVSLTYVDDYAIYKNGSFQAFTSANVTNAFGVKVRTTFRCTVQCSSKDSCFATDINVQ